VKVAEHLAQGLQECSRVQEIIQCSGMSGIEGTSNIVHEFEIELEQLQSRLDHLKAQVSLDFLCHSVDYHALQCSYAFYRCLHGTAPSYITESLLQTSDIDTQCSLHSTGTAMLVVLSTRHSTVGNHVFPVTLARAWNSLPSSVRKHCRHQRQCFLTDDGRLFHARAKVTGKTWSPTVECLVDSTTSMAVPVECRLH